MQTRIAYYNRNNTLLETKCFKGTEDELFRMVYKNNCNPDNPTRIEILNQTNVKKYTRWMRDNINLLHCLYYGNRF